MKKIGQVSHTKVAEASVGTATAKPARKFNAYRFSTQILRPESYRQKPQRRLHASSQPKDPDTMSYWATRSGFGMPYKARAASKIVFDSYSSYKARTSHLRALEQIISKADELINLLESQPADLRPGISIEGGQYMGSDAILVQPLFRAD